MALTVQTEMELSAIRRMLEVLEPLSSERRVYTLAAAALILRAVPESLAREVVGTARGWPTPAEKKRGRPEGSKSKPKQPEMLEACTK